MNYNVAGVFFHNNLNVNCDPEKIGGIFLYNSLNNIKSKVNNEVINYLKKRPTICLAKNYVAPMLCKEIFNCKTVYLVSGINYFNKFNTLSASQLLNKDYKIDKNYLNKYEIKSINACDLIVCNSSLTNNIFNQ